MIEAEQQFHLVKVAAFREVNQGAPSPGAELEQGHVLCCLGKEVFEQRFLLTDEVAEERKLGVAMYEFVVFPGVSGPDVLSALGSGDGGLRNRLEPVAQRVPKLGKALIDTAVE